MSTAVMSHDLVNFIASKWKAVSQNPGVCRAITREIEVATTLYEARHSESSMDKDLSRKESLNLVHISCMYVRETGIYLRVGSCSIISHPPLWSMI